MLPRPSHAIFVEDDILEYHVQKLARRGKGSSVQIYSAHSGEIEYVAQSLLYGDRPREIYAIYF